MQNFVHIAYPAVGDWLWPESAGVEGRVRGEIRTRDLTAARPYLVGEFPGMDDNLVATSVSFDDSRPLGLQQGETEMTASAMAAYFHREDEMFHELHREIQQLRNDNQQLRQQLRTANQQLHANPQLRGNTSL
jgi:hypothetical protein